MPCNFNPIVALDDIRQQVQLCLLKGRVCQDCSRKDDKEKARGGDRDVETLWEVPEPLASHSAASSGGVDTVGILSEFGIRR